MKGVPFTEANRVLAAPEGAEDQVYPLHVQVTNDGQCISCWEVTPADVERMRVTGRLWLSLWSGQTMPPALVQSESPFL